MLFDITGVDEDTVEEFLSSLYESLECMEHELTVLERDPANEKAIHNLVLAVNQLKSHCRMCYLEPFVVFLDGTEALFLAVRAGQLHCSNYVREVALLGLDTFRHYVESLIQVMEMDLGPLLALGSALERLAGMSNSDVDKEAVLILERMATSSEKDSLGEVSPAALVVSEPNEAIAPRSTEVPAVSFTEMSEDLLFFKSLAESLETRYLFWKLRSRRSLSLALSVNHFLDAPVDEQQLSAAVYMHDLGMLFVPDEVVNKTDRLNALEERMIRQHPTIGYEWLKRMQGWSEAAELVRCHHERPDGKGYPRGLFADDIPTGAQIISVVDTYFAITRQRADRTHKKSLLRAVKEIHHHLDTQFKPEIAKAMIKIVSQLVV